MTMRHKNPSLLWTLSKRKVEKKNIKSTPFFTWWNKYSISTEFQLLSMQCKWHPNWILWWINNESHWNPFSAALETLCLGCVLHHSVRVFDNPLPQRNQIDWQGYHDDQVSPPSDCQFHRQRCALQKFEPHRHYPGNGWDDENANLMLISQVKFELETARAMNTLESPWKVRWGGANKKY